MDDQEQPSSPDVQHVRLEFARRTVTVLRVETLSRSMKRVTFGGPELEGFHSPSPDDHIKIFLPAKQPDNRPRLHAAPLRPTDENAGRRLLPPCHWDGIDLGRRAEAGDTLLIGGPRRSKVIRAAGSHWILIGDASAIPSVGRRLAEMKAGESVTCVLLVDGPEDEQRFRTEASAVLHWVHRRQRRLPMRTCCCVFLRTCQVPIAVLRLDSR